MPLACLSVHSGYFWLCVWVLCLWIVYQLFLLITGKHGMGHGDFKLLAALGAWLGPLMLPLIVLYLRLSARLWV